MKSTTSHEDQFSPEPTPQEEEAWREMEKRQSTPVKPPDGKTRVVPEYLIGGGLMWDDVAPVAQEPVGWQFYQDGKWHNGMDVGNHRVDTEAAGIPTRDVFAHPVVNQSLTTDADRDAMAEAFEAWWVAHGQYCRAGGGDYEKTFAYRAYEHAYEQGYSAALAQMDGEYDRGRANGWAAGWDEAHAQQPVSGADGLPEAAELIVRDVCELDPANPNLNDTICIDVSDLLLICRRHTAQPQSSGDAGQLDERAALEALLEYAERQVCTHEETHRGGAIWEICDACGAKWADDEGGKPEFEWPKEILQARAALAAQASGQHAQDPLQPAVEHLLDQGRGTFQIAAALGIGYSRAQRLVDATVKARAAAKGES